MILHYFIYANQELMFSFLLPYKRYRFIFFYHNSTNCSLNSSNEFWSWTIIISYFKFNFLFDLENIIDDKWFGKVWVEVILNCFSLSYFDKIWWVKFSFRKINIYNCRYLRDMMTNGSLLLKMSLSLSYRPDINNSTF